MGESESRKFTEQPITITLNGKQKNVSGVQAAMMKLQQQTLGGDKYATRLCFQMLMEFISAFAKANPEVTGMVETLHRHLTLQPDGPDADAIEQINKLHRKTRGLS